MNKNKIILLQFPKPLDRPSFSPFCLKLETYLKVAKIPYENKFTLDMGKSQKKKMPMIIDEDILIEDSTFIIKHLKDKYNIDLDAHLTNEEKAISKAFQWLCEKSIVDIVVYFRWCDKNNWPKFKEIIFKGAPWPIKMTVANIMSASIKRTLYKQGIGRFTDDEKLILLRDNLKSISDFLGNKTYFFGDSISSIDTILYAVLIQVKPRNVVSQFEGILDEYKNLNQYLLNFESL